MDEAFLRSRVESVYSIAFAMIAMDLLGSAMMTGLLWRAGAGWPTAWMLATVAVLAVRSGVAVAYRSRHFPHVSARAWGSMLVLLAAISGMLWALVIGPVAAFGSDDQVMFSVCVMLSGLTLSIAHVTYLPMYAAFQVPVMLSVAVGFAMGDRPNHVVLASAAGIMTVVMLATARRLADQVLQAQRLAVTNQALVDSLAERGRELERAFVALEQVSRTDPLTGLANRRARDERLEREWERAERLGAVLTVIAIDVDRFKRYNDTHGHDEGDRALRAVGTMLHAATRGAMDMAARHGGEEFMLILPGVSAEVATSLAERVRVSIAQCREDFGLAEKVTISLGVATADPAAGGDMRGLTTAADMALYRAKLAGRNRYEVASTEIGQVAAA